MKVFILCLSLITLPHAFAAEPNFSVACVSPVGRVNISGNGSTLVVELAAPGQTVAEQFNCENCAAAHFLDGSFAQTYLRSPVAMNCADQSPPAATAVNFDDGVGCYWTYPPHNPALHQLPDYHCPPPKAPKVRARRKAV